MECLLSHGAEYFVFQFATQKYKDYDTENYNFARCFVWVWNLVTHTEGLTEAGDIWEEGAEENVWA